MKLKEAISNWNKYGSIEGTEKKADNSPVEVVKILDDRIRNVNGLMSHLKTISPMDYRIGDFYQSDLPRLRSLGNDIDSKKKDLESAIYKYLEQADKDFREFESKTRIM